MTVFGDKLRDAMALKCRDKQRYASYAEALDVAKDRTNPVKHERAKFLQPYACEHGCGGFHITSRPFRDRLEQYPVIGDLQP
jgi:hypothetical protein